MTLSSAPTSMAEPVDALVIGGGPAGLMAAEMLSRTGLRTIVAEAMPTAGRKLLMAGKSGLNLTKVEAPESFLRQFGGSAPFLSPMLREFGPGEARAWAEGLGQETFTGSTGRLFPRSMKASPLMRAWLSRLTGLGVSLRTSWRWDGCLAAPAFATPEGVQTLTAGVVVLALGGASWRRLGSDGAWAPALAASGVGIAPFQPSNAAVAVDWSEAMARHFGAPAKAVRFRAGNIESRGEAIVSRRGLEGGGVYALTPALRRGEALSLDLAPDLPLDEVARRLSRPRGKATRSAHLRRTLRLDPVRLALLHEFGRPLPEGPALAERVKNLPVAHRGLRPLDEAISTAGGVRWDDLDRDLMLSGHPGVFVAGEMIDWEAPTGGYLLTACLATGRWAGLRAAEHALSGAPASPGGSAPVR